MFHYVHLSNVGQHQQQPSIRIEKGSKTTFTAPLQFKVNATATREVILYLGKQKFYLTKISMSTNWKMHSKPYQATPQLGVARVMPIKIGRGRPARKGLKSQKRFTNLPLQLMSSILNQMGFMLPYGSPGVSQSPKSYDSIMEVST